MKHLGFYFFHQLLPFIPCDVNYFRLLRQIMPSLLSHSSFLIKNTTQVPQNLCLGTTLIKSLQDPNKTSFLNAKTHRKDKLKRKKMNDVLLIIRNMGKQILEHNINRYSILNWLLLVGYLYEQLQQWSDELINIGNGIDIDTLEWTLEMEIDLLAEASNIEHWRF